MGDIVVQRTRCTADSIFGMMFFDGFTCFTLEPLVSAGETTVIPAGRYQVISDTTGIEVMNVNKFYKIPRVIWSTNEIRIHIGNTLKDTKGCLLVGTVADVKNDQILHSTAAYTLFNPKFQAAIAKGNVYIRYFPVPSPVSGRLA